MKRMVAYEDCNLSAWLVLIYVNIAPGEQAACGSLAMKVRKTDHRTGRAANIKILPSVSSPTRRTSSCRRCARWLLPRFFSRTCPKAVPRTNCGSPWQIDPLSPLLMAAAFASGIYTFMRVVAICYGITRRLARWLLRDRN
jgi:hypothetical protein